MSYCDYQYDVDGKVHNIFIDNNPRTIVLRGSFILCTSKKFRLTL